MKLIKAYITIDPNVWFLGEAGDLLPSTTANEDDITNHYHKCAQRSF